MAQIIQWTRENRTSTLDFHPTLGLQVLHKTSDSATPTMPVSA